MNAAVLHCLGELPRFEEFCEPTPTKDTPIIHVRAAALKPVDKQMANGSHYASPRELPVVCGTDGVGCLDDGERVFFAGPLRPYGAMAQRTIAPREFCFAVPDSVADDTAAALPNPAVSAWLSLAWRAKLIPGENVLILGATGVTGKLAVQIAKLLGAGRVVAAGRNESVLASLQQLGADAAIRLVPSDDETIQAFAREAGDFGLHVVVDYLWGRVTELLLGVLTRSEFARVKSETRLVQAGESAGPTISLSAAALRSAPLSILGTAGIPPREVLDTTFRQVMARAAAGQLHINTEKVPLAEIGRAWQHETTGGRRPVIIP
jgi:NADPH:quinone reductase-like Zn-dependent oxidoreductase